jgi:hypothetical protein
MALSATSLDAVSGTGVGVAITFDVPKADHSILVTVTGSPATATVHLE